MLSQADRAASVVRDVIHRLPRCGDLARQPSESALRAALRDALDGCGNVVKEEQQQQQSSGRGSTGGGAAGGSASLALALRHCGAEQLAYGVLRFALLSAAAEGVHLRPLQPPRLLLRGGGAPGRVLQIEVGQRREREEAFQQRKGARWRTN